MGSKFFSKLLARMVARFAPIPESFMFGDGIAWDSPLVETSLYVELPFWMMTPPGMVEVSWADASFTVEICRPWTEVFAGEFTDSRRTVLHQGPQRREPYVPPEEVRAAMAAKSVPLMERHCKTVLRLVTQAHSSAFRKLGEGDPPRAHREQEAYWASLCEAHIPVVNELIQRYRLVTYDYFAYEVSAWDVPIWYLKHADSGYRAVLLPYKSWDVKPVTVEEGDQPGDPPKVKEFEWTSSDELGAASSSDATPGEFDLLDARSLMERGDYTGAIRRTATAIEAEVAWALENELVRLYGVADAARRLQQSENDFPGRLSQWRKLAGQAISQQLLDELETTRQLRHDIVHRGRRITHRERGTAQRAVDTGRWLYNEIEAKPDRTFLRDRDVLKSAGRVALDIRFPATVGVGGITLGPFAPPPPPGDTT